MPRKEKIIEGIQLHCKEEEKHLEGVRPVRGVGRFKNFPFFFTEFSFYVFQWRIVEDSSFWLDESYHMQFYTIGLASFLNTKKIYIKYKLLFYRVSLKSFVIYYDS